MQSFPLVLPVILGHLTIQSIEKPPSQSCFNTIVGKNSHLNVSRPVGRVKAPVTSARLRSLRIWELVLGLLGDLFGIREGVFGFREGVFGIWESVHIFI